MQSLLWKGTRDLHAGNQYLSATKPWDLLHVELDRCRTVVTYAVQLVKVRQPSACKIPRLSLVVSVEMCVGGVQISCFALYWIRSSLASLPRLLFRYARVLTETNKSVVGESAQLPSFAAVKHGHCSHSR